MFVDEFLPNPKPIAKSMLSKISNAAKHFLEIRY